jgi:hypothetical protein
MITKNDLGQNITAAVNVLNKTFENLNLMFTEMDVISEEAGFVSLTPKFLRWKSDSSPSGWLTNNFIKLYQIKDHSSVGHLTELKDSDIYCVEIDLEGENSYPEISLTRIEYDFSVWSRIPSVSDHWIFWNIFRDVNFFNINGEENIWTSEPYNKSKNKYWGIKRAVSKSIPLVTVSSAESIRTEIFENLRKLGF